MIPGYLSYENLIKFFEPAYKIEMKEESFVVKFKEPYVVEFFKDGTYKFYNELSMGVSEVASDNV